MDADLEKCDGFAAKWGSFHVPMALLYSSRFAGSSAHSAAYCSSRAAESGYSPIAITRCWMTPDMPVLNAYRVTQRP